MREGVDVQRRGQRQAVTGVDPRRGEQSLAKSDTQAVLIALQNGPPLGRHPARAIGIDRAEQHMTDQGVAIGMQT